MLGLLLLLLLASSLQACIYKEEKYKDGQTWVVRGSFLMRCTINADGSWLAKVVGCRTNEGKDLEPGQNLVENDTLFSCVAEEDGSVKLTRASDISKACDGHTIGESWTSNKNFKKECQESGARIVSCLTDVGLPIALNSHVVLAGVAYTCTAYDNGTVTINRQTLPSKTNTELQKNGGVDILQPQQPPQPQQPEVVAPKTETTVSNTTPSPIPTPPAVSATTPPSATTCFSEGAERQAEETWVVDNTFTKKCTGKGSTVILNCLINSDTTINLDSEVVIGNMRHRCIRKEDGGVLYKVDPL